MTKYILAGGNDRGVAVYPDLLKKELPENLSELSVLSCFFSVEENEWSEKSKDWQDWFSQKLKITKYEVARFSNFEEKLREADIIYFHGGNTWLLLESLSRYENLKQKFEGKIVIGSSAGANMLSDNFWSSTFQKPGKGLAILDVNIMVHYGAKEANGVLRTSKEWANEKQEFSQIIQSAEILELAEGTFKVFDIF